MHSTQNADTDSSSTLGGDSGHQGEFVRDDWGRVRCQQAWQLRGGHSRDFQVEVCRRGLQTCLRQILLISLLCLNKKPSFKAGSFHFSYRIKRFFKLTSRNRGRYKESTVRGHRKNLSPRQDSNPRPSVFQIGCSNLCATDHEDSLTSKGHFCELDLRTASRSHAVTKSITSNTLRLNCITQSN